MRRASDAYRRSLALAWSTRRSIVERGRGLSRDAYLVLEGQLPFAAQTISQAFAFDIRHGEPELTRRIAGIVDREDVGMLQPRGQSDLALEAFRAEAWPRAPD